MERAMGFGPTTSTLARLRSTPELYPHRFDVVFNSISKINCKHFLRSLLIFYNKKFKPILSLCFSIEIITVPSLCINAFFIFG